MSDSSFEEGPNDELEFGWSFQLLVALCSCMNISKVSLSYWFLVSR